MCVGSHTAGTWFSSQWRPDNEFETDTMAVDVVDPAHQPNTSVVQHRQIEGRMIWSANQLKGRLVA